MKATALDFQPAAVPQGRALDFKRLMLKALDGLRKSAAPAPKVQARTAVCAQPAAARAPGAVRNAWSALSPQPLARLSLVASSQDLRTARGAMHIEADRLQTERFEAQGVLEEKLDSRMLDVICRELTIEFGHDRGPAQRMALDAAAATGALSPRRASARAEPSSSPKAAVMVALVDRIEALVRAGRPAIAVHINHPSLERAEIERVGPREIALRLLGKNGPPPPDAVSLIREEMAARGLKLAALTVG
jgi:hypothetical protein